MLRIFFSRWGSSSATVLHLLVLDSSSDNSYLFIAKLNAFHWHSIKCHDSNLLIKMFTRVLLRKFAFPFGANQSKYQPVRMCFICFCNVNAHKIWMKCLMIWFIWFTLLFSRVDLIMCIIMVFSRGHSFLYSKTSLPKTKCFSLSFLWIEYKHWILKWNSQRPEYYWYEARASILLENVYFMNR